MPSITTDNATSVLNELLDRELGFEVGAHHGFNNHLPMMLTAAARLGASPTELRDLFDATVADDDYLVARTTPAWLATETAEIDRRGIDVVVAERASSLVDSPTTHWFHAPIRLEYAIDARHPGQVANSLHDWAEHRSDLPPLPADGGTRSLIDVARDWTGRDGMSIGAVTASPWFADDLSAAHLDLDAARALALAAHVAGNSISTLHLMTGARAAAVVADLLEPDPAHRLGRRIAQSVAAGYVASGAPALPTQAELDSLRDRAEHAADWSAISAAALETGDAHVIKLAYTCVREADHTGDPLYRWVATRAAGLGPGQ